MNETLSVIAKRFSCRSFTDKIPSDADLDAIALAGVQAPSGMNRQGWQVIIVKDQALIGEMDKEGMKVLASMPDLSGYNRIMSRGGTLFYNAPRMIVVAVKEGFPKGAELVDCGIVAQNIVLAATSLGIDNVHCGFAVLSFAGEKGGEFKQRLNFPQGYECGIGVLLGYAEKQGTPHAPDRDKITVIG